MTASNLSVGCAGAGILGSAIMKRLIASGFDVHLWNRNKDKLAPVLADGGTEATDPAVLAHGCDIVITCVTDGAAVEQIVFGPGGVAEAGTADKVLVDMSTIDANHAKAMAGRLKEACGMRWVDAPISGGAPKALTGSMTVMCGGTEEDFRKIAPVMDALAGRCTLMGGVGAGQTTKMINQVLVACGFAVLAEACGLAQRAGVDAARIPDALAGGRADSALLQEFMGKMARSDWSIQGRLAIMMKDLEMIHDLSKAVGAPMPVTGLVAELHRKLLLDGLGDADNTTFAKLYREPSDEVVPT